MKTDKLSMQVKTCQTTHNILWARPSISLVESPSCHNGFPLDLADNKNNGVAIDLFYASVIGHPRNNFLNQGSENPSLRQMNWSAIMI